MPLIVLLLVLYSVFLATLHVPMLVSYFVLKRFDLLRSWHFMASCAVIFAAGHVVYVSAFMSPRPIIAAVLVGTVLGLSCGYVWWYILVKRIGPGTRTPSPSREHAHVG